MFTKILKIALFIVVSPILVISLFLSMLYYPFGYLFTDNKDFDVFNGIIDKLTNLDWVDNE